MEINQTSHLAAVNAFRSVQESETTGAPAPAADQGNSSTVTDAFRVEISQAALELAAQAREPEALAQENANATQTENTENQNPASRNTNDAEEVTG